MNSMDIKEEIEKTVQTLKAGGLILYPTDTIWGIGCDASNETAVQKLLQLKGRISDKGLILLLDQPGRLASFVRDVPATAWDLIEFSDKPLTIIYEGVYGVADSVRASDGSVGIRITKNEFCQSLVEKLRKPIVSTSANISGRPFATAFADIEEEVKSGVDYIVNLRRDERTEMKPSTVLRLKINGQIEFIRS